MTSGANTTIVPRRQRARRERLPARLCIVFPPELLATIQIEKDRLVLGRAPEDEDGVVVSHPTVSRRHLALTWDAATHCYVAEDLGSKNGSRVDEVPLEAERRALSDGDVVRLGDVLGVFESSPALLAPDPEGVSRDAIPGESGAIGLCRTEVGHAGQDRSAVLIIGETGTGKELLAREIHRLSGRAGPFVAVNCAELTGELMESQLFGHARGAFTGANQAQGGLFRAAERGTLFLDEIGELPEILQPKLLRALQEGEIRPVGETKAIRVDVRVVAATNRDLTAAVELGGFRRDLYARLALWEVHVPNLRARRRDLLEWIERLDRRWRSERGRSRQGLLEFDADAAEALVCADWPDNLRGLDRLVHRLASRSVEGHLFARSEIEPLLATKRAEAGLEEGTEEGRPPAPTAEELQAVLEQYDGSVRAVAKHYRRDRKQVYRWLRTFGLK